MIKRLLVLAGIAAQLCACAGQDIDASVVQKMREIRPCQAMGQPDLPLPDDVAVACLKKFNGPLQREYLRAQSDSPSLGGRVVLDVRANASGEVTAAQVADGSTMPGYFAKRVATFVGAYALLPPSSTGWSGKYLVEFAPPPAVRAMPDASTGFSAALSGPAGHGATACASLGGPAVELKEEDVRACVERNNGRLQAEYQRWLRKDPTLKGTIVLEISSDPTGRIRYANVMPESAIDPGFAQRIAEVFAREIVLPPSASGWTDKYTLNFFPT